MPLPALSLRQYLTYLAHQYKAVAKQHHGAMLALFARHIGRDSVVLDVGAHAGQFCKLFAGLAPEGKVYAFEPGAYARTILERMVRWRRLGNVEIVAAGLSDRPGSAGLALPLKASGSLGFGLGHLGSDASGRRLQTETVRLDTIDGFVAARGLVRLDFIKADIEGWEVRLLLGGRASLARFHPALMLELVADHLARADNRPAEVWDILTPLGYRGFRIEGAGELRPVDGFAGDADYLFVAVATPA